MRRSCALLLSMVILGQLATPSALAQAPKKHQSTAESTVATKMDDVSKWSRRQWNAAKAKWSHERAKWAGCRKQAHQKRLSGRKSWTFLYHCMTR
ncbi:MAG: hypothetical protein JO000_12080 [Alphaproteobacteria bacterium]|nr:hypothetical protein [Alphaproteobacteria bacterium]